MRSRDGRFNKPLDFVEIRAAVMLQIVENKEQKTDDVIAALKGRYSRDAITQAIRYMRQDGHITRDKYNQPWKLKT